METPFVLNLFSLCCVWMEGNEGGVEGRGGEGFNHLCLGVFLNGRGKDLRGFEGFSNSLGLLFLFIRIHIALS